ncbi:MAG TPA: head GIN domain-containing protein [Chitinophagales bacterium]|nr:head GIN domain-containing protein [Chitinophagales bacterium]
MNRIKFCFCLLFIPLCISTNLFGQANKEVRKPGAFSSLKVYGRFDVILVKGEEESVTLESEKTELDNIVTEVEENKLKVRMKMTYFQDKDVKVVVTYKQLEEISAGAGAHIDAGTIEESKVILKANSGSQISAEVIAGWLEAESTQGAIMHLSGKVKSIDATVNTGGQLNGFQLNADSAKVKVMMGGLAKVTVKEKLDANVTMGGNISYKGNPREVKRSDTMGGTITEIRE